MASVNPEIFSQIAPRNVWKDSAYPERIKSSIVLGSDIEGPWFKGDFIAEAMTKYLKPQNRGREANPSYGQIIYTESLNQFTEDTFHLRRPLAIDTTRKTPLMYSRGQEGTDTIFTLPFLLAEGASYYDLMQLTLGSTQTPGSKELVDKLEARGIFVVGITTAPQQPYRDLAEKTGFIDPKKIIGSPFPIEETRKILHETDAWDVEMGMTKDFLEECYEIIDNNSGFTHVNGVYSRSFSAEGSAELRARIKRYYDEEIGISYDFRTRKLQEPKTVIGKIIQLSDMVGDRAKAAISQNLIRPGRNNGRILITMGDGGNDAAMLRLAPISIGVNGPDAAKAAKIGVITPSMVNVYPIFEEVARGQHDIDQIILNAQKRVGDAAIIHKGGSISESQEGLHRKFKRELRGDNITY